MQVHILKPFRQDKNLGLAYNEAMSMIGGKRLGLPLRSGYLLPHSRRWKYSSHLRRTKFQCGDPYLFYKSR
jgi:hypothetical protein